MSTGSIGVPLMGTGVFSRSQLNGVFWRTRTRMFRPTGTMTFIMTLILAACLLIPTNVVGAKNWTKGDEKELLGHTFEEHSWTNDSIEFDHDGGVTRWAMSYVKKGDAQAFLIAFRDYTKNGNVSTLPYQLFGMHFYTPKGREVFLGAVLAFMMAFNDSYNGTGPGQNGLPDPGNEEFFFVLPFGVGEAMSGANGTNTSDSYAPEVDVLPVTKEGDTYSFGMRYRNLYALATKNPLASLWLRTGYILKFSELMVEYRVTFSEGKIEAETYYTIGQVSELWAFILGVPIKMDPSDIPDTMGMSMVHFVTVFTPVYKFQDVAGSDLVANRTKPTNDLRMKVGDDDERAFDIGFLGTYDLINETTGTLLSGNNTAINALVAPTTDERNLVNWQAGFSLELFARVCYGMTERYHKMTYPVFKLWASIMFKYGMTWYAVSFPEWGGHRIVHDPVYTTYVGAKPEGEADSGDGFAPGFGPELALLAVAAPAFGFRRKRKRY